MNTTQLECFVKVAETLNFVQAAEHLHLSQPAVSKQIASLEAELGTMLFSRTTHSVALTRAGQRFLPDAQSILHLGYHAKQTIRASRYEDTDSLRIGYTDSHELIRLSSVFQSLRVIYPRFTPILCCDSWDANIRGVQQRELDLCLCFRTESRPSEAQQFLTLLEEKMFCVVPKGHPLSFAQQLRKEQVYGLPQVLCIPHNFKRRYYAGDKEASIPIGEGQKLTVCTSASEAYALVRSGFGYCLLPEHVVVPEADLDFLEWPIASAGIYGVILPEGRYSKLIADFIRLAQAFSAMNSMNFLDG